MIVSTTDGNPGRTTEVTVVVDVVDYNDNQPKFLENNYNATIPENLPIGTTVLTVNAEDEDLNNNAVFKYSIVGGEDKFEVTDNGVIITKALLDYESKPSYTFLVSNFRGFVFK